MSRVKFEKDREVRIEEKKDYYAKRSEELQKEANAKCEQAINMAKTIPFGQPIHIGHHSEKSDRRFREKIDNKMRSSSLLYDKSNYYAERAKQEKNSIHSLDEFADEKIQDKINRIENLIFQLKEANKIIRKINSEKNLELLNNESIVNLEIRQLIIEQRETTLRMYANPRFLIYPFTYSLTNNGAELRRLKKRLEIIKLQDQREPFYFKNEVAELKEEESRINVYFNDIPSEKIRGKFKKIALKWSPTRKAWTRSITTSTNSNFLYRSIVEILKNAED